MSCAHSDGWFGVRTDWRTPDDGTPSDACDSPGLVAAAGDTLDSPLVVVGRCRVFAPFFDGGTECAEGLVVMDDRGAQWGLYWAKPSRTFRLIPLRDRAP